MKVYTSSYSDIDLSEARRSIYDHLFSQPHNDGDKAFIDGLDPSRFITRRELKRLTLALAWGLRNSVRPLCGISLKRGDTVMVFSPNSIEYPVALLGAVAAGLRITLANASYTAPELAHQYKDSGSSIVLVHPALLQVVLDMYKSLGVSESEGRDRIFLLVFSDQIDSAHQTWHKLDDIIGDQTMRPEKFDGDSANETVYLCYSSGTTGLSKGVESTHFNIAALCTLVNPLMSLLPGKDIVLGFLPFFHIFGLSKIIHYCFFCGASVVVIPRFQLDTFCQIVQDIGITFSYVVPPVLVLLANHPMVDKFSFSTVRMLMSGAAPLGPELALRTQTRLRSNGGNTFIVQGYGLTETSPTTHVLIPEDSASKPGSVGKLLPNLQARLVTDDDTDADLGQPGELWIKGPTVMKGYLNNAEATRNAITRDSWFKTGDIATIDKDNFYYIVDRKKELIKYKGFQVPPADLENLLLSHPQVMDAAVIGIHSKNEATELPRAYIVPKGGLQSLDEARQQAFAKEIAQWVKARVANHKQLRGGVSCVETIPKSAAGKILRRLLRETAQKDAKL